MLDEKFKKLTKENIVSFLAYIFEKCGDEEYLGDSELARQIFKKMKDNASDLSGYEDLLGGLCDAIFRDEIFKEDAIDVANETLKMCSSIEDSVLVIEAFIREDQINDHQKALEIINTFIDQVTTCDQHRILGNFACQVGNKELGIQSLVINYSRCCQKLKGYKTLKHIRKVGNGNNIRQDRNKFMYIS